MALLCPPFFSQDLNFFGLALTAETANSIWFGTISTVLTAMGVYGCIQALHILFRRGFQKQLDPISFSLYITFTVTLYDNVGRLLFSR